MTATEAQAQLRDYLKECQGCRQRAAKWWCAYCKTPLCPVCYRLDRRAWAFCDQCYTTVLDSRWRYE